MFKESISEMEKNIALDVDDKSIGKCRIEEVLSSKGRILILKTLAEMEELNISAIARVTNLNHSTTTQHLEFLTKAGLVQEKKFGRIKIFRYRSENIKARSLKKLFEIWE
jgi:predicted transcriptional regulator